MVAALQQQISTFAFTEHVSSQITLGDLAMLEQGQQKGSRRRSAVETGLTEHRTPNLGQRALTCCRLSGGCRARASSGRTKSHSPAEPAAMSPPTQFPASSTPGLFKPSW